MAAPPRRPDPRILLAAIAVLAFAMVVAAVLALRNTTVPAPPAPTIELGSVVLEGGGNASVAVASASDALDLSLFRVDLRAFGPAGAIASVTLHAGVLYTDGTAILSLDDTANTGMLGPGDTFRLLNFPTQTTYSLTLVYVPEGRSLRSVTIPL